MTLLLPHKSAHRGSKLGFSTFLSVKFELYTEYGQVGSLNSQWYVSYCILGRLQRPQQPSQSAPCRNLFLSRLTADQHITGAWRNYPLSRNILDVEL